MRMESDKSWSDQVIIVPIPRQLRYRAMLNIVTSLND